MAHSVTILDQKDILSAKALFELMEGGLSQKRHLVNYLISLIRTKEHELKYAIELTHEIFSNPEEKTTFNSQIRCLNDLPIAVFFEQKIMPEIRYLENEGGIGPYGANPWFVPGEQDGDGPTFSIKKCCEAYTPSNNY
jgi:hypothetical protein